MLFMTELCNYANIDKNLDGGGVKSSSRAARRKEWGGINNYSRKVWGWVVIFKSTGTDFSSCFTCKVRWLHHHKSQCRMFRGNHKHTNGD